MTQIKDFCKRLFLDNFYLKFLAVVLSILTILPFTETFSYRLLMAVLALGAVQCITDLFYRRRILTFRYMIWLILFCIVYLITIILNIKTDFKLNFITWSYTIVTLFVLYPNDSQKSKEKAVREVSAINYFMVGLTAVLSTVSLVMFVIQFSMSYVYQDHTYSIGWYNDRLFGIYGNTGFMISTIGMAMAVIQLAILYSRKKKDASYRVNRFVKFLIPYSLVVNFLSMILENSRSAMISIMAFLFIAVFFYLYHSRKAERAKLWKKWIVSITAAALSAFVFFGVAQVCRQGLAYVPPAVSSLWNTEEEPTPKPNKVNIDRDIPDEYGMLTGRTQIWKFGMERFLEKPLFGYGADSFRDQVIMQRIPHFHNFPVQSLVSVGVVGSFFIFGALLLMFLRLFKKLFLIKCKKTEQMPVLIAITAFLCMLMVNSMAEVTILFLARTSVFLFWIYMGYAVLLSDSEEDKASKLDRPLHRLNKRIENKFHKAGGKEDLANR